MIREILLQEWDPIGINDEPGAQHEYDAYVAEVDALVVRKAKEQEIFQHLWEIETGYMGLAGNREKTEAVAKRLSELV